MGWALINVPLHVFQILTFLQFGGYTLVRNSTDLFQSFGFDTQPVLIGLIIFQVLYISNLLLQVLYVCVLSCLRERDIWQSYMLSHYRNADLRVWCNFWKYGLLIEIHVVTVYSQCFKYSGLSYMDSSLVYNCCRDHFSFKRITSKHHNNQLLYLTIYKLFTKSDHILVVQNGTLFL